MSKIVKSVEKMKRKSKQTYKQPKVMKVSTNRLERDFFNIPCQELAIALLGKLLVRKLDNNLILKGRIVETECYPGGEDKASSTYDGRHTDANDPLYKPPGTAFVYMTYGMYHCLNVSSMEPGGGVLLRALEPVQGIEAMRVQRLEKLKSKEIKDHQLCNGPSKLCISMSIDKASINHVDICASDAIWVEDDDKCSKKQIVKSTRIGIDKVEKKWSQKPWRFYLFENVNVSKRDVKAESEFVASIDE